MKWLSGPGMIKWLWLSGVVIILDQLSKYWVRVGVPAHQPIDVLPVFRIVFVKNDGAAAPVRWLVEGALSMTMALFGVEGDIGAWQRALLTIIAILVSVVLVRWLSKLPRTETWTAIALALILGGALGNVIDRLVLDYVVDFADFYWGPHHFPAFNLADSAITIGAIMLIVDVIKGFYLSSSTPSQ
jgi:signal peptidase II